MKGLYKVLKTHENLPYPIFKSDDEVLAEWSDTDAGDDDLILQRMATYDKNPGRTSFSCLC